MLSGCLIGGILMDARDHYRTFYTRRFFRIIQIYFAWITAYILLAGLAGGKVRALSNSGVAPPLNLSVYSYYLFFQNLHIANLAGLAGAWFGHLWSLAVEEQFYLLAPLVVRFVAPRKLPYVLTALIVCVPLLRTGLLLFASAPPSLVTVLMPCRADALAVGVLLAAPWTKDKVKGWLCASVGRLYATCGILSVGVPGKLRQFKSRWVCP